MEKSKNKIFERLAKGIIKFKLPIVLIVLGLTIFFGYELRNISIDSDIVNSLPDSDPAAKLYKEVGDKYEGNSAAIVILECDNVFDKQVLEDVKAITDSFMVINGVSYVTSLTNIIDIKTTDWGLEIGKLIDENSLPETGGAMDSLRDRVFEKDMYHGVIVSDDSTATVIIASLSTDANRDSVVTAMKQAIKEINPQEKVYYTGVPFMMRDTQDIIVKDLFTLLPVTALIIILLLYFGFRSWRGVVLPLLNVLIAIIWTLGLMTMLGYELTVISDVIPIILLALGSAYTIHVLNRINEEEGKDRLKALIKALSYIIVPVFLAYITTAFGFVSFVFGSYLTMIRDFGIFTAIGITFAFLLSVTFIPAFISLFSFYKKDRKHNPRNSKIVTKFLQPLINRVLHNPKRVLTFWFLAAIVFAGGIFMIQRKVDMVSYFKEGSETRIAQNLVDAKLGGASPVYIVMKGDVQSPEFLQEMKDIEDYMKNNSAYVDYTLSIADLVCQMNEAMGEGYAIPDSKEKIEQLWMLIESEDIMPQLVSYDLDEAVIQGRFASLDTKLNSDFVKMMNNYLSSLPENDIKIEFTGMPPIYERLDKSLVNSQMSSLALAIVLMLLIVSLTLKSFKYGIWSIIPLLLTLIISFGFMGYSGIPLDIATVLVASVTLGVGIDYAVHIISHYKIYLREYGSVEKALTETVLISGNAIFINVLAVAMGFLVFLMSQLVPLNNFGVIMALSMFVSGFAAVTLLPALIFLFDKKSKNNKNQEL